MLAALAGAGIGPDLVLGTSIGGINGAFVAAHPVSGVTQLGQLWQQDSTGTLLGDGLVSQLRTLRRTLISLHSNDQLESLLSVALEASTHIEDLPTPFGCVASCIETASATWFEHGPLVPALLASAAVPGLFGPVVIEGRHYIDGGLVDSIPLGRAVERGARTIFVLQVGRIERPLEPPRTPAAVARVSFEIARRHRFTTVLHGLPPASVSMSCRPEPGRRRRLLGVSTSVPEAASVSCCRRGVGA